MRTIFYSLPKNILSCFRGRLIVWHLLAAVLTFICAATGFDWFSWTSSRGPLVQSLLWPAVRIGGLAPVAAPLALLIIGPAAGRSKITITAYALIQSVLIGLFISSGYKALTGRVHPPRLPAAAVDISREFRFGFLRGGVFWGWPSSHTTIAFAMSVTLLMLCPKRRLLQCAVVCYALYIGLGVSVTIHWFSDFVAGAIVGTVIGAVVGQSFRENGMAGDSGSL